MSEEAEPRSSLPALCRPSPSGGPFVLFRHPVRELPDLLTGLEKPAPVKVPADFETRRRRLRWQLLLGIFLATAAAMVLDAFGFQAGLFSRYVPLLWFAAILVTAGTSPAPPAGKTADGDPVTRGFRQVMILSGVSALLGLVALRSSAGQALYAMLGFVALFLLVRQPGLTGSAPRKTATAVPAPAAPAAAPPDAAQLATLQACREVLEAIAEHAPHGAQATGWLDLTPGPETAKRSAPRVWWRLRLPWGEGVRLRLAGLDGENGVRILVNLAVSPRLWLTDPGPARHASFGLLTVDSLTVTPSRISTAVLASQRAFRAYDLIELLKSLEERLRPRPLDGSAPDPAAMPPGGPA